jgi:hypothetical protein
MDNQVIPFPVDRKADLRVTALFAFQYILELAKTNRTAMVIWEGEPPTLPYRANGWSIHDVPDISVLPMEMQRRIYVGVNMGIPIKQILIAHEETRPRRLLDGLRSSYRAWRLWRTFKPYVQALAVVILTLAFAVATAVSLPGLITAVVGIITGILKSSLLLIALLAGAAIFFGTGGDPAVVALVDDIDADGNDVLSWVCLGAWYE